MQGFFFLKQFSICLFLITDIPFTEYNERKKRNLTPQNFRPALHILTNRVSGEMPVQLWRGCVCVCVCAQRCVRGCAGAWLSPRTGRDPRPARGPLPPAAKS